MLKKEDVAMSKEGLTSVGAVVLAFLASQHHTLHMMLFTLGLGGAGMSFMTMFPIVRRVMLLMSLSMVGLMVYHARDTRRPISMRIMIGVSILVTLGLVGWSVLQFGL
jgi:ATP-dependent protease HslVU (ClpYQ) peptidase subunit